MDYALNSIIGKRENQEDYGEIYRSGSSGGVLAVIADGMGGQVAGEIASSNAVKEFVESFVSNNSQNLPLKLTLALNKANRSLARGISKNPKLQGMGATLIAAHIEPRSINWVSVGDSILYLYREKKLQRLNDDHSMMPVLQESVRRGKITAEESLVHPHRNALRSALTGDEIPIIDLREEPFPLKKGDLVVLATDGILTLSEPEISSILKRYKSQPANVIADQLLDAVTQINKSRQDNTLVEVIKIPGGFSAGFKWTVVVMVISIIVIVIGLASFDLKNKEMNLQPVGIASKEESSAPGINALPVPPPTGEKNDEPNRDQTQLAAPSASSTNSSVFNKSNMPSQDRKSPPPSKTGKSAESKSPQKEKARTKSTAPDAENITVQSSSIPATPPNPTASNSSGNNAAIEKYSEKNDSPSKSEIEGNKQSPQGGNPPN